MPPTATTTTSTPARPPARSPSSSAPPPLPPPSAGTRAIGRRLTRASTPARLSALRAVFIALALVFAVGGSYGVNRRADAIGEVRSAARQLLALQDIEVRVVHADAIASSSYLRSGQEDPAQRTAYLDEIAAAGDGLVAASGAATASDLEQLSVASRLLGSFVGLVEQARANNRQGFPVGATYQRQANAIVSNTDPDVPDIVSSLRAAEASQRAQINSSLATAHRAGAWLQLTGWALMAAVVAASLWMARTFRRVVNVPIAAAGVVLLLLMVFGGSRQARAVDDADAAVGTQLTGADRAAQARAAAFEARSQEALTLINRGNGAANEANWQRGNDVVTKEIASGLGDEADAATAAAGSVAATYASYQQAHRDIRALDDGGDWDAAVAVSLGRQPTPGGADAVKAFDDFDRAVGGIVTVKGDSASARLGDAVAPLRPLRNVVAIAGLLFAALTAWGCGQRLREYR